MKSPSRVSLPLIVALLLTAGGCTSGPTVPSGTATSGATASTGVPGSVVEFKMTLVTNIGTAAAPAGASNDDCHYSDWRLQAIGDNSVVFQSCDPTFPGANGKPQIYSWTPATGITLVSNAGTDSAPVGADGDFDWRPSGTNSRGQIVFASTAANLHPDGNPGGFWHVYLWTPASGLTLISDADSATSSTGGKGVFVNVSDDGAVVFNSIGPSDRECYTGYERLYRWTAANGLVRVGDRGTVDSVSCIDSPTGILTVGVDGSILFSSDAVDLPGANGQPQLYLWTAADGLALVSNAGTLTAPVGSNYAREESDFPIYGFYHLVHGAIGRTHSVVFTSDAVNLPGSNSNDQVYLWTPTTGLTLVTNVGTATAPVGANGSNYAKWICDDDSVVFVSGASDLPGGRSDADGSSQIYRWSSTDGLTLVTNAGTDAAPWASAGSWIEHVEVAPDGSIVFVSSAADLPGAIPGDEDDNYDNYQVYRWSPTGGLALVTNVGTATSPIGVLGGGITTASVFADGSILFSSSSLDLPGGRGKNDAYLMDVDIYRWTARDGITLVTNGGTAASPVGVGGDVWPVMTGDGSVVFTSSSSRLPGGNGQSQIYIWTPLK